MTRTRSLPIAAGLLTAATLALAAPASAQGGHGGSGGGGGGTPPVPDDCSSVVGTTYDDGTVAGNFNTWGVVGGCTVIVFHDDFTATVEQVQPQPGWTYRLNVHDQSSGTRVTVEFTEAATGHRTTLMVEPGKTVVK